MAPKLSNSFKNFYWIWKINKKYNNLNLFENFFSLLLISLSSFKKYGLKNLSPLISFGASPRGSINLALASKCFAFIKHRGFVIPEDVREVISDVLRHRIGLTYEAEAENVTSEDVIKQIINTVEVP